MTPPDDDSSPLHLTPLPGSDRPAADVERPSARSLAPDTTVEATVVLRRRDGAEPTIGTRVDRADFAATYGADPADIALVEKTLGGLGLTVVSVDPASRRIRISGTIGTMERVFGARLQVVTSRTAAGGEVEHRNRTGQLMVPAVLDGVVTAVLGLDDRPQARAEFRVAEARAVTTSYTPLELGEIYRFPPATDGSGQTIAIIELGGGFAQAELDTYFSGLGITGPTVTAVGVDGAENRPGGDPDGADGEVLLDIEVAGALSPGAHLVVYFAPNTDDGFVDAVSEAAHAEVTPASISISWGLNEDAWTEQARRTLDEAFIDAAALGITVTAAAGDNGSSDGVGDGRDHADFPASSPHVLACGGTTLRATARTVTSETVWNNGPGGGATGGGVSAVFPRPPWQTDAGVPAAATATGGRGIPDVAAVADPSTGYEILVDGERRIIGGTSAVAPLWAALIARIVQATGQPLGLVHPLLYDVTGGFRDVVVGDNGSFEARIGWDACTGLGVPDGAALLSALRAGSKRSTE
ncbi:MAG: S53 family peptidase [Lacisediminihabitans sp.]